MIRVLIVDDHAVVRRGLEQLIASAADLEIVGSAVDGEEAVNLAAELGPDVILMDLSMPVLDGIAATRRIVAANPAVHVVVLTSFDDERRILDALGAGPPVTCSRTPIPTRCSPRSAPRSLAARRSTRAPLGCSSTRDGSRPRPARSAHARKKCSGCSPVAWRTSRSRAASVSPSAR